MTTLHPRGEVDLVTVAAFEQALEGGIGTERDLVVDLSELTFIDAAGLRVLATAATRIGRDGRRLRRVGPTRNLGRLLHLVGLGDLIV
jgi:anti-anti-sigma factor